MLQVEVGFEHAYVFGEIIPGPGGLPVGTGGRVELLLSGGIDSPVAGWLCQKRGCTLSASYFHSPPYTGDQTKDKVLTLARSLATWQPRGLTVSVVPFTEAQRQLRDASGDGRLAVVLYRRMMLRVAERIGRTNQAQALVTGEALGQVASQTIENMGVIGAATTMTVLRPCVAHDKRETIELARRIGTYDTSTLPYDDCCSLFVPDHPETKARLDRVLECESKLDIAAIADDAAQRAERHTV
jgi:thiamine biosynthesis protein ThiI